MTTKTFRAVEQGFHAGLLIQPGATFTVDLDAYKDETGVDFKPNWAVEVDDGHETTPTDVGQQEQLNIDPAAALPTIDRPDQPLAPFHPAVNVPQSEAAKLSVEQAKAENGDPSVPVRTTAEILAEAAAQGQPAVETPAAPKARKSRRKPDSNSIDTGTDASDAQKDEAEDASQAEVDAAKDADKAEGGEDDGNEFV